MKTNEELFVSIKEMILNLESTTRTIKFFSKSNIDETKIEVHINNKGDEYIYLQDINKAIANLKVKLAAAALKIDFSGVFDTPDKKINANSVSCDWEIK
jgi:hypothetical protein